MLEFLIASFLLGILFIELLFILMTKELLKSRKKYLNRRLKIINSLSEKDRIVYVRQLYNFDIEDIEERLK